MTKNKIKLTALILLISVIFGTLSVFASDNSMTEIRSLKVHNDPDFPVDFRLSVPVSQEVLDPGETIPETAELKISMKEEYADTYCYMNHFSIKEDESTINENGEKALPLLSDTAVPADSTLTVDIVPNEIYNFSFEIYTRTATISFLGSLNGGHDWDGTLCLDILYKIYTDATVQTARILSEPMVFETESNNLTSSANILSVGAMARGYLDTSADTDYFKFTTTENQNGYIDIRLIVPQYWAYESSYGNIPADYDLYILNNAGVCTHYSLNRGEANEYLQIPVSGDSTYYICTISNEGSSAEKYYTIELNYVQNSTWYTQLTGNSLSFDYYTWNTYNMNNFYFPNYTVNPTRPLMKNDNNSRFLMDEGCAIASIAMIIKNAGATMYGRDIRSGVTEYLKADPYSVTLANVAKNGTDTNSNGEYNLRQDNGEWKYFGVTEDPVLARYSRIAGYFDLSCTVNSLSGTDTQKAEAIESALTECPNGVVVGLVIEEEDYDGDGILDKEWHYIAFVNINSNYQSSKGINNKFIVCDPGTSRDNRGNNVSFDECYSYIKDEKNYTLNDAAILIKYITN